MPAPRMGLGQLTELFHRCPGFLGAAHDEATGYDSTGLVSCQL